MKRTYQENKSLYESIMRDVAKIVKHHLNEDFFDETEIETKDASSTWATKPVELNGIYDLDDPISNKLKGFFKTHYIKVKNDSDADKFRSMLPKEFEFVQYVSNRKNAFVLKYKPEKLYNIYVFDNKTGGGFLLPEWYHKLYIMFDENKYVNLYCVIDKNNTMYVYIYDGKFVGMYRNVLFPYCSTCIIHTDNRISVYDSLANSQHKFHYTLEFKIPEKLMEFRKYIYDVRILKKNKGSWYVLFSYRSLYNHKHKLIYKLFDYETGEDLTPGYFICDNDEFRNNIILSKNVFNKINIEAIEYVSKNYVNTTMEFDGEHYKCEID